MKRHDEKASKASSQTPARAAVAEQDGAGIPLVERAPSLEDLDSDQLQDVALSEGVQTLWQTLLPLIGVAPAIPAEFPGVFRIEAGPENGEATIFLDIPSRHYVRGQRPRLERVLALTVRLEHDYRRLGDTYYCVDCEPEPAETRH